MDYIPINLYLIRPNKGLRYLHLVHNYLLKKLLSRKKVCGNSAPTVHRDKSFPSLPSLPPGLPEFPNNDFLGTFMASIKEAESVLHMKQCAAPSVLAAVIRRKLLADCRDFRFRRTLYALSYLSMYSYSILGIQSAVAWPRTPVLPSNWESRGPARDQVASK